MCGCEGETWLPPYPSPNEITVRVLVCGDRNWEDVGTLRRVLEVFPPTTTIIIHGDARGADRMAGELWFDRVMKAVGSPEQARAAVERYPANWRKHGRAAGPLRNQAMLDTGVDLVIAFHNDLSRSKGTADMIRRAIRAGITTVQYTSGLRSPIWHHK
jgi:hypothetical protein